MQLKKVFAATAACALLVGTLTVSAMAHGGHGHRRAGGTTAYPVCTVTDCTLGYRHDHDGVTYCGHSSADGHTQCVAGIGTGRHGCRR